MADFPFDIVLFDLDGTLVDSALDLGPAVNHALSLIDRKPVPLAKFRSMIGGGTDMMLSNALHATGGDVDHTTYEILIATLHQHYWANIAENTVPFPGCKAALDTLAQRGCALAICTNKSEKPARELLDALGMTDHFAAIYGGDTLGWDRAKPKSHMLCAAIADCGGGRAAMVGDSTYDVRAAKAASVPMVTCRYGYHDVRLAELGGDATIDGLEDLVAALEALG
ncbi:HAD-IA family hydrolase [Aurantiacibacter aquimixticola]|uniref:phosphoglycolate phosphatase n=1 Tax=Aurantiacibacter aquimixticola TaxID=1958945 RepID=A0A419RQV5_9SPHN|nr:HAD-IA family hydrolase [Aurantiacibacter aquimixticola]RJY08154.1 HAD family hydrolase [Aurantiacibacter aquimixticola]